MLSLAPQEAFQEAASHALHPSSLELTQLLWLTTYIVYAIPNACVSQTDQQFVAAVKRWTKQWVKYCADSYHVFASRILVKLNSESAGECPCEKHKTEQKNPVNNIFTLNEILVTKHCLAQEGSNTPFIDNQNLSSSESIKSMNYATCLSVLSTR